MCFTRSNRKNNRQMNPCRSIKILKSYENKIALNKRKSLIPFVELVSNVIDLGDHIPKILA